jgi:hypothetical protein
MKERSMHIHPQINPNMQLDNLYAAGKAAAKREVERTRRKLLECASELSGEADSGEDCIVELAARQESKQQRSQQNQAERKNPRQRVELEISISDWA